MKKRSTIHVLLPILVFLLAPGLVAQPGMGQNDDPRIERIRMELERTEQLIERAREAVDVSRSPAAAVAVEKALQLQEQARARFQQGNLAGYLQADKLTREARELARKALIVARSSEQNEDRVLARLERVQDLLDRTREYLSEADRAPMRPLFELAVDNLDKAWQFYRANQHRVALKLADHVESTARRVMEASGRSIGGGGQYNSRLERVEQYIERVRQRIADGQCGSEAAVKFIEQAERGVRIAREAAMRGEAEIALESLEQAQRLATEAGGYCDNGFRLEHQYERLKSRWEQLSERAPSSGPARDVLAQAADQLELARDKIGQEEFEAAAAALRVAQMQLGQVEEQLRIGQP